MTLQPQHPQPPSPAASAVGVPDDAEARAAELADLVEDERRQQKLDDAELGGEG
jgi:hypothetical protein